MAERDKARKIEHGRALKGAMSRQGWDRTQIAELTKVKPRTVTNWTSGETMPEPWQLDLLKARLGNYHVEGDPVEAAVRSSELTEDRQYVVLGTYHQQLREQRREAAG